MKVNTNHTGSLFEKIFAKHLFNSEKETLISEMFRKIFSFSIDSPFFKKAVKVLAFFISVASNFM